MKPRTWGIVALILSLFICLVVVITAIIDSATFLSRLHTTIIAWQLPLVAIAVIIYSFIKEREELETNVPAWVAVLLMAVSMFCSNITKNAVQDVGSNVENYVDVAASIIKQEKENVTDYKETIKDAIKTKKDRGRERDYYNYGY